MGIRSVTISYATLKKKKKKTNREESLIKDIELLEKNDTRENEDGLKTKQKELQELRKKENGGNADTIKSYMDRRREKVSTYFCNLLKRHYTSKIIRKIEKQDGTIVTEQDDIERETKYFGEHLYKHEEQINDVTFKEIIQEQESIPKLTEQQCNSLEGKISKDEVLSTLKRMKKMVQAQVQTG